MKRALVKISVLACVLMLIVFTGCGIKSNPVVKSRVPDYSQIVKNFRTDFSGDEVVLKWDFFNMDSEINYVAIEKSEVGSAGNECRDCPRTFERIAQIPVKETGQKIKENNSFDFKDKKVIHGKTYNYRLMLCDDSDMCYESSSTEVNFR